jgi:hypothetical protein
MFVLLLELPGTEVPGWEPYGPTVLPDGKSKSNNVRVYGSIEHVLVSSLLETAPFFLYSNQECPGRAVNILDF